MLVHGIPAEAGIALRSLSWLALVPLPLLCECVWAGLLERWEQFIKQSRIAPADKQSTPDVVRSLATINT